MIKIKRNRTGKRENEAYRRRKERMRKERKENMGKMKGKDEKKSNVYKKEKKLGKE